MHFGSHVFSCVQSKDGRTEAGGGQDGASSSGAFSPAGSSTAPLVALAAPGPAPRAGPPLVPAPVLQTPVLSALAAASSGLVAALPVEEDKDLQTRIEEKVDMGMFVAAGIQAHQELPFYPQQTAWPRRVNIAEREARWMRPELSKVLSPLGKTQLPASARGFEVTIDRNLVRRRGGAGPAALLRH